MTPTRQHLSTLIAEFERIARALVAALVAGQLTLAEFDDAMRAQIRTHHLAAAALANGGRVPDDTRTVQAVIDEQMGYFDRWSSGLYVGSLPPDGLATLLEQYAQQEAPKHADNTTLIPLIVGVSAALMNTAARNQLNSLNAARLGARAASYAGAARQSFSFAQTAQETSLPPLPFYAAQYTQCHNNCLCDWDIVKVKGGFDCYWRLNVTGETDEHCPTCLARAAVANPLRVRNGIILDAGRYQAPELYA